MRTIETTVELDMAGAEAAIRVALGEQGFGVLTEIDVAATLKARIDVDRPPLKILGACNPDFANRALQIDPSTSLLLPCNVVLEPAPQGGTRIAAVDPRDLMTGGDLADLAEDAAARLGAAVAAVGR